VTQGSVPDQGTFPLSWAPMAHVCDPSYLGGRDREDHGLRPAWANSLQDPISKITRAKWTRDLVQTIECLLCKCKALSSNPSPIKKTKTKQTPGKRYPPNP
jgi:hypothetical protein